MTTATTAAAPDSPQPGTAGIFSASAVLLLVLLVALYYRSKATERDSAAEAAPATPEFKRFQRNFMLVYLLAMFADWLQGAHVYALYASYGFSVSEIRSLFVGGFGSSMIFGTVMGSMADRFGRRRSCLVFAVTYTLSCMTKHSTAFGVLYVGRVLGGMATSLLMSSFEAWMIHEHKAAGFPDEWLGATFSLMTFGNGVVAIVAGFVAQTAVLVGGLVGPFDVSALVLVVLGLTISCTWKENYGDNSSSGSVMQNMTTALHVLRHNQKVALLGLVQACFETSMYCFVFLWTPALEATMEGEIPHGVVFACFMMAIMVGSFGFKHLLRQEHPIESFARYVFLASALALMVPATLASGPLIYGAFLLFEAMCGCYFPAMGTMRSKYVPEEVRATVMNLFRVGLNLGVIALLYQADESWTLAFGICGVLLSVAALAQHTLLGAAASNQGAQYLEVTGLEKDEVDEAVAAKADASV